MNIYLCSFYPLCCTKEGQTAIQKFRLPPFIDGSCRREPDLTNSFPAITGLCRPGFAKKLENGDIVIYISNKKGVGSRRIIAVLEVIIDNCTYHQKAADWYIRRNCELPNNLMVKETNPIDINKTHRMGSWDSCVKGAKKLEEWNKFYIERAENKPKVAICKILYKETLVMR
jgi:hypothetical protein